MLNYQTTITKLQAQLNQFSTSISPDSSPTSSKSSPRSPNSGSSSSSSGSISDMETSPLGSTTKKRKISAACQRIISDFDYMCENHKESLAHVLGNSFVYGTEDEQENVRSTISDIIKITMVVNGDKQGITKLLSGEIYQRILKSMS